MRDMSSTELKSTTEDEWHKIDSKLCQKLVSNMKTRIFKVIKKKVPT